MYRIACREMKVRQVRARVNNNGNEVGLISIAVCFLVLKNSFSAFKCNKSIICSHLTSLQTTVILLNRKIAENVDYSFNLRSTENENIYDTMFTSEIELTLETNMVIRTSTGSPATQQSSPSVK